MTQQQFIEEIKHLSIAERIALIEEISRSVREDLKMSEGDTTNSVKKNASVDEDERERRVAAVRRLRGIIKFDGPPPPEEELKEDYVNYLIEKYS
ncbi:MAG: hypothetical protein WCB68_17140 [Pyrinomonadaceae bacterium]